MITLKREDDNGTALRVATLTEIARVPHVQIHSIIDGCFQGTVTIPVDDWRNFENACLRRHGFVRTWESPDLSVDLNLTTRSVTVGGTRTFAVVGGTDDGTIVDLVEDTLFLNGFMRMTAWWRRHDGPQMFATATFYTPQTADLAPDVALVAKGALAAAQRRIADALADVAAGGTHGYWSVIDRFRIAGTMFAAGYRTAARDAARRAYPGPLGTALRVFSLALLQAESSNAHEQTVRYALQTIDHLDYLDLPPAAAE